MIKLSNAVLPRLVEFMAVPLLIIIRGARKVALCTISVKIVGFFSQCLRASILPLALPFLDPRLGDFGFPQWKVALVPEMALANPEEKCLNEIITMHI